MKGTEKQIKYAMDILTRTLEEAKHQLAKAEQRIAEREAAGKHTRFATRSKMYAENAITAISEIMESGVEAGYIINHEGCYGCYDIFVERAEIYDFDMTRMLKYYI